MKDQSIVADRGDFSLNVSVSGINRATPQPPCAFTNCEILGAIGVSIGKTGGRGNLLSCVPNQAFTRRGDF